MSQVSAGVFMFFSALGFLPQVLLAQQCDSSVGCPAPRALMGDEATPATVLLQETFSLQRDKHAEAEKKDGRGLLSRRHVEEEFSEASYKVHRRRRRIVKNVVPDLPGQDMLDMAVEVAQLVEEQSAFLDALPSKMRLTKLMSTAASDCSNIASCASTVADDFLAPTLNTLSEILEKLPALPEFSFPHNSVSLLETRSIDLRNGVNFTELIKVDSSLHVGWLNQVMDYAETLLDDLSSRSGFEMLAAAKASIIDPSMSTIRNKVLPMLQTIVGLVEDVGATISNAILTVILPPVPSQALLQADANASVHPFFAKLKRKAQDAVRDSCARATLAAVYSIEEKSRTGNCEGLANEERVLHQMPAVILDSLRRVQQTVFHDVMDEVQPFIDSSMASNAAGSDDASSGGAETVSLVPLLGPVLGVVADFILLTANKVFWILLAPQLISGAIKAVHNAFWDAIWLELGDAASDWDVSQDVTEWISNFDLPPGWFANLAKWLMKKIIGPDVEARLERADALQSAMVESFTVTCTPAAS